jgi:mannose-6-phosphate isomerase-like protein (cupin superfamily)
VSARKVIKLQGKSGVNRATEEPPFHPEKAGCLHGFAVRADSGRREGHGGVRGWQESFAGGELQMPGLIELRGTMRFVTGPPSDGYQEGKVMKGKAEDRNFGKADEVRVFPKGKLELLTIGGATIGRATLEPGWRWSTSVQPIAKTKSCEAPHFQYHVSGTMKVVMDDGTEFVCKPGDVSVFPSGHDAWVVGNESVVVVDFQGMAEYATKAA